MNKRDELLKATARAADVLARFPVGNRTSFDIVGAVAGLGIPLLFRPLDGLWGAALVVDADLRGILVTTKLDLHVQRFTLAHELGHLLMDHQTSLDETIGFAGRHGNGGRPIEELAADSFASELLAPKSLMIRCAQRHRWNRAALSDAGNVYQLALRLGLSFPAMCWALVSHDVLDRTQAEAMQARPVKELKRSLAPEDLITNSWANVWRLTQPDTDAVLEAGPEDLFVVHVLDDAGGGYVWQLVDATGAVEVVSETEVEAAADGHIGAPASRAVYLRLRAPGRHRLVFEHARPWSGKAIGHIDIAVENHGKETGGWPRRLREASLAGIA